MYVLIAPSATIYKYKNRYEFRGHFKKKVASQDVPQDVV